MNKQKNAHDIFNDNLNTIFESLKKIGRKEGATQILNRLIKDAELCEQAGEFWVVTSKEAKLYKKELIEEYE